MKALSVIGMAVASAFLLGLPSAVLLGGALLFGLALVWWLTDSPIGVGRHRHATWFDRPATTPVVVKAARAGRWS